ncbi:nucleotidyltransferase domain-containing protein [Candidatus Entotheonella palauensis]|nr:nucleotidyltransferase domain-containing protein [Candidatus Entotheonella palauensis]
MADPTSSTQPPLDPVIQEFAACLRQRLGSQLDQVLLFGSRARGEAEDGSDYDMLVVVDHRTADVRAIILDIECQLLDRYGALVATVLRSKEEWQKSQGFPLARNIAREGRPL